MLDATWFKDGHSIFLELHQAELVVTTVHCPGTDTCKAEGVECMVRWWIDAFGLECNVGICEAAPQIEIAWSYIGDKRSMEEGQLWIIPVDDYIFSAFAEAEVTGPEGHPSGSDPQAEEHDTGPSEGHTESQQG